MASDLGGFPSGGFPLTENAQGVAKAGPFIFESRSYANQEYAVLSALPTPVGSALPRALPNYSNLVLMPVVGNTGNPLYRSITADMPDGTNANGNARGLCAVDLQMIRSGKTHVASGLSSFMAGGEGNIASGRCSVALGASNYATGDYSYSHGYLNSASGTYSTALGLYAYARLSGQLAFASSSFATAGDAQASWLAAKAATTDATPTALKFTIPASTTWLFRADVVARKQTGSDAAGWTAEGMLTRDASNNTALVGVPTVTQVAVSAGAGAWALAVTADDTNEALAITGTGEAATNIHWVAKVALTEVAYA